MRFAIASLFLLSTLALASNETRFKSGVISTGPVAVGTNSSADASAILDTVSTTKGARPCPPMTQTQRDAIATPATGLCVYNTTTNSQNQYNGTAWVAVGSGSGFGDQRLTNGDFEGGTSNWTASTGTFTTQAATLFAGNASGKWVLSAATGSLSQDLTPAQPLQGVNLETSCWVNTTASTFQLCARQAGSEIQCTAIPSSGTWQKVSLNMPGPSSGSIGVDVSTTGSTTGTIYVDQCYVGSATNLAQVSQARLIGTATVTGCGGTWATSGSGSFGTLGTPVSCSYAVTGLAQAPSTNVAGFKFASLPPGDYKVEYEGVIQSTVQNKFAYFQFTDGTTTAREISEIASAAGGALSTNGISQTFSYSTAQSNVTWQIFAKVDAGGTAQVQGVTGQPGTFRLYYYPSASQTVLGPDATAASWGGYLVNSGTAWTVASAGSYTDFAAGTSSLTVRNATNITCSAASGNLPGITCNLPKVGKYRVCASSTQFIAAVGGTQAIQIYDGTNEIGAVNQLNSTGNATPFYLCGTENATGVGSPITFKLRGEDSTANAFQVTNTSGQLQWTIEQLDAGQPAPLLTGSVTSSSSGVERIERVKVSTVCTSSPCTLTSNTPGVTSVSRANTGAYSINFAAGTFSAAPTCTGSSIHQGNRTTAISFPDGESNIGADSATRVSFLTNNTETPYAANDSSFQLVCMGPR